jgi:hypothetical protein
MTSTIPGSNLENISISLLMSKCLFIFGVGASDIREVCFVIGVVLHHLWLSVIKLLSPFTVRSTPLLQPIEVTSTTDAL